VSDGVHIESCEGGVLVRIKAVPGSSQDRLAGAVGDRLKVRTSAPPEGGKANKAICRLLATAAGVKARDVEIVAGHTNAEKTARIIGLDTVEARRRLTA
jgi:uncharacterized protein (TIGR00251 family)